MKTTFNFLCFSRSAFYVRLSGILTFLIVSALFGQTTSIKVPTADSSSSFRVLDNSNANLVRLNGDAGFYFGGSFGAGTIPTEGAGTRLMWYPAKSAFRVGYISSSQWNNASIGNYSTAMGENTTASGIASVAMGSSTAASGYASMTAGYATSASGSYSTAMGYGATASGVNSTARGYLTYASGDYSTAMGYGITASGHYSTAMGYSAVASGEYSTAIGNHATALGNSCIAIGIYDTANGINSLALGTFVSTNNFSGSCIIGDGGTSAMTYSSANYQMTMRFSNGYRLFSNTACTTGVTLSSGGSSWSSVSDARKKENYSQAHGEYFLKGLAQLKLGSWNYIGQDPKTFRHYGPMAQEIFRYFGKDSFGSIGNDTTLASADMDGIMMICLQALEKRTRELNITLNELKTEKEKVVQLQTSFDELKNEVDRMKSEIKLWTDTKVKHSDTNVSMTINNEGE